MILPFTQRNRDRGPEGPSSSRDESSPPRGIGAPGNRVPTGEPGQPRRLHPVSSKPGGFTYEISNGRAIYAITRPVKYSLYAYISGLAEVSKMRLFSGS